MGTGGTGQIGDPGRGVQVRTEAGTGQEKGGTGLGARTGVRGGGYRGRGIGHKVPEDGKEFRGAVLFFKRIKKTPKKIAASRRF